MGNFDLAPSGVTERDASRNGECISKERKLSSGWRKQSQALLITEKLAEEGEKQAVSKATSIIAIKKVGAHIGLKAADLLLLDTLCAFTQPQDWEEGRRPIVWPSNALLMQHTGFSLSALKRHIRRLAEACVVAFQDSPNGKRWGHRDIEGHIVEAYGFDLSPLAARAEEFECLYAQLQAERVLCQRLSRQITVVRRSVRARLDAPEAISDLLLTKLRTRYRTLVDYLPRFGDSSAKIQEVLNNFNTLSSDIDNAAVGAESVGNFKDSSDSVPQRSCNLEEVDPREVVSEPHIQTTNDLKYKSSSERTGHHTEIRASSELHLPTIIQACPEFKVWARDLGGYLRHWSDVRCIIAKLCPMIGISEKLWEHADQAMDQKSALAAIILTFEKFCKGELLSPSGYLRGMMKKSLNGNLNLERSFYGRLHKSAI